MKIDTNYIFKNMAASIKTMLGNSSGLSEIDHSASGFWRSFLALILAIPFTLSSKYSEYGQLFKSTEVDPPVSVVSYLFIQETAALLAYLVSLAVLSAICRSANLTANFPLAVISLNWASLAMTVLSFPALVVMGSMDNTSAVLPFLVLILMVVFSLAMFNVLRLTLQISIGSAVSYVVVLSVFEIVAYFYLLAMAGL